MGGAESGEERRGDSEEGTDLEETRADVGAHDELDALDLGLDEHRHVVLLLGHVRRAPQRGGVVGLRAECGSGHWWAVYARAE